MHDKLASAGHASRPADMRMARKLRLDRGEDLIAELQGRIEIVDGNVIYDLFKSSLRRWQPLQGCHDPPVLNLVFMLAAKRRRARRHPLHP